MKKLFIISFAIISINNIIAQSATGQASLPSSTCCFNGFTWNINYSFTYNVNKSREVYLEIHNRTVSVKNNKYQTGGKQYSPSDVGMSEWPVSTDEIMLSGTVTIYYNRSPIKTYNEAVITSNRLGTFDQWKEGGKDGPYAGIGTLKIKLDDFNVNNLSVKFSNVSAGGVNPKGAQLIYKAINAKQQGNTNNSNENNSLVINSSSTNPVNQNNSSTKTKLIDNYNAVTGLYTNPLITGSNDKNSLANSYAQGQQIADLAVGIVGLFTPSPEEQARKEQARIEAEKKAEEYRQLQLKLRLENEKNATADFKRSF